MLRHSFIIIAAGAALVLSAGSAPALAASDGSSGQTDPIVCDAPLAYDADKKVCAPCETGTVYEAEKKACVVADASLLDDAELYRQGNGLALAGHYESALEFLSAVRNKHDAMVLTMIGYSKRKLGAVDEGIAYYQQALAIDPDNLNTHEYLGEGYLASGRIDLAEAQLDRLQALCGIECEQYQDLAKAITGDPVWH